MKYLVLAFLFCAVSACATISEEQAARLQAISQGFNGLSNQLRQQQQDNYQQMEMLQQMHPQQQTCYLRPDGFGGFTSQCY